MSKDSSRQTKPEPFDLVRSQLRGFNLIDASAGTGKTYTICGLVLRLLLEKNLSIDQILVVTYTEAATEDLRNRIRQKLRNALDFLHGSENDDGFLHEYLATIDDWGSAELRFSDALRGFDEAAIHTIHSFCQRQLIENSFESNTLFNAELVADDSYITREIVEDFWRSNFYQGPRLFTEYVHGQLNPQKLIDFLAPFLSRPFLQFIPSLEPEEACGGYAAAEAEYTVTYRAVCKAWQSARIEVAAELRSDRLKRNIYKLDRISVLLTDMDEMASAGRPGLLLPKDFSYLTSSRIAGATKKKATPCILPFNELCEKLLQLHTGLSGRYDRCLLAMKRKLVCTFHHEFALRKERKNIFSFDDLLRRLHDALSGPQGAAFAAIVARKYPAVLIDEFQDTDPLQFKIFSALYRAQSLLFLIGDPKQAIYSFRGADIFTYMEAAASSPLSHYTLDVNYRSTPSLVKAVNTLFSQNKTPFIFDAISFQPVAPASKKEPERLTFDCREKPPFVLWHLQKPSAENSPGSAGNKKTGLITKTMARQMITAGVAAEIAGLLALAAEDRVYINEKRLTPGDIAVLVRTNNEARQMQTALAAYRVPSVVHSTDNLFRTEEAGEIALLLDAVAAPYDIRRLRTALLTRIIGLSAENIEMFSPEAEKVIEQWQARFKTYHDLWGRFGFIRMFWTFMAENRVRARILAVENGERILTNILHLAEILHQEADSTDMNMTALLDYLQRRLAEEHDANPEHQLRLESDADRVKIVTIHKAKGLEYPIVFCPFTWEGALTGSVRGQGCIYHRQNMSAGRNELVYDGGSPELDEHLEIAMTEELAENLRLFYVAVTRAIHRCYFAWGLINEAGTSAPAFLLHQGAFSPEADGEDAISRISNTATRFQGLSEEEFLADLERLAASSEGTISLSSGMTSVCIYQPGGVKEAESLQSREFTATIPADWKINSFSSLSAFRSPAANPLSYAVDIFPGEDESPPLAIQDETDETVIPGGTGFDIFSLPHGTGTGLMLHELLEQTDFSGVDQTATDALIYSKLSSYGFDPAWQPVLAAMLTDLGGIVLREGIPGLTLGAIPAGNLLHEVEFYFPLAEINPESLRTLFHHNIPPDNTVISGTLIDEQLGRLTFSPARGFMKGFIDLIFEYNGRFYLADWKSNYLGPQTSDYRQDRLLDAIYSGYYFLQYHLYCLALHLYLENRMAGYSYDEHFGGVFYVFLRGVKKDLGPGHGIFFDRPPAGLIENFAREMIPGYSRKD